MPDNLLNPKKFSRQEITFSRLKRRFLKHVWLARIGLVAVVVAVVWLSGLVLCFTSNRLGLATYAKIASNFIFTPADQINTISGRTNILILGKSGLGHEAPDLTDTVIFASVSHSRPSIVLISLPRDIWLPDLRAKLNSAYYWGNQKETNGGLTLAKSAVEEIVGQPINYALVIDFSGFQQVIDAIGGIEVEVENAFVDQRYPITGREKDNCGGDKEFKCRYETIEFQQGLQHLNGETALKFVRSRNAEGDEGTDLARAARQERVIAAIKNKVLSPEVLFSPIKIKALLAAIEASTETDINLNAAAILTRRIIQARNSIRSEVLPADFLDNPPISPTYDNLYVFVPQASDWRIIHQWVADLISN